MSDAADTVMTQWGVEATAFSSLSDAERRKMVKACAQWIAEIRAATGLDVYLAYGGLLGAVRDGRLIPHDFDLDVGFHCPSHHPEVILETSRELQLYLARTSDQFILTTNGQFKAAKLFADGTYLALEFFASYERGPDYFLYFAVPGEMLAADVFPLSTVKLEGVEIAAPRRPEVLLESTYGAGWRSPDPGFAYADIDWAPFRLFTIDTNHEHWERYYDRAAEQALWAEHASPFAQEVIGTLRGIAKVLEIGSGNGRDALAFARQGHEVVGVDYSASAVTLAQSRGDREGLGARFQQLNLYAPVACATFAQDSGRAFDIIYARFLLHAVSTQGEDAVLAIARETLKPGGTLWVEFRNSRDELAKKGVVLSESERHEGHYRRFVDADAFEAKVASLGFATAFRQDGQGLAAFGEEDPNVTRMALRWADAR